MNYNARFKLDQEKVKKEFVLLCKYVVPEISKKVNDT